MRRIISGYFLLLTLAFSVMPLNASATDATPDRSIATLDPLPALPLFEDCFASNPGAGNTNKTDHYNWGAKQSLDTLVNDLWAKIVMVYGCSIVSNDQVYQLFGELSGLVARRAYDARCFGGDRSVINTDDATHERWARTKTRVQVRDNLGWKALAALRCLDAGHNRLDFFATASATLARAPTSAGRGAHPVCDGRYALWGIPAVRVGQQFTVNFAAPAGRSATDWIGIFPEGVVPNGSGVLLSWQYVPKGPACGGYILLRAPAKPGRYYVYYLENNGYKPIGGGVLLTVNP